ncbi:MAG: hypothetical protein K0U84_18300 [Actinomycetia bacterium]|nr:hypothetical protein [Actinomycetes bacterium]
MIDEDEFAESWVIEAGFIVADAICGESVTDSYLSDEEQDTYHRKGLQVLVELGEQGFLNSTFDVAYMKKIADEPYKAPCIQSA